MILGFFFFVVGVTVLLRIFYKILIYSGTLFLIGWFVVGFIWHFCWVAH